EVHDRRSTNVAEGEANALGSGVAQVIAAAVPELLQLLRSGQAGVADAAKTRGVDNVRPAVSSDIGLVRDAAEVIKRVAGDADGERIGFGANCLRREKYHDRQGGEGATHR